MKLLSTLKIAFNLDAFLIKSAGRSGWPIIN